METQIQKTYKLLRKAGSKGVKNYQFANRGLLRYSHFIRELRLDGYSIRTERLRLKNGRWSNVWTYTLHD